MHTLYLCIGLVFFLIIYCITNSPSAQWFKASPFIIVHGFCWPRTHWGGARLRCSFAPHVMDQVIQEDLVARLASEGGSRWLGSHVWHLGRDGWRLDLAGTVDRNICSQPLQRASLRVAGFFTWWSALPTEQVSLENCHSPWKWQNITNTIFCLVVAVPGSSRCRGKGERLPSPVCKCHQFKKINVKISMLGTCHLGPF